VLFDRAGLDEFQIGLGSQVEDGHSGFVEFQELFVRLNSSLLEDLDNVILEISLSVYTKDYGGKFLWY